MIGRARGIALALAALTGVLGVVGCEPATESPDPRGLTVYAAASLTGALRELEPAWTGGHPDIPLSIATDSSAALGTQIEQGATADVFLSADLANPMKLADAGLADGAVITFAGNRLAIVTPASNPARVAIPADLARPGVKIIAAGDNVPISTYAAAVIGKLSGLDGYPPDFAASYAANVVTREVNVAAVLAKIELGEGDAAIVYETDAAGSSRVDTIPVPNE
ncbi:MAG TPA: molybdate ABC transporter substrate-binding protein, partial [Candidatus Limnocylindrales bacterium]|nr:molybdate ABC transporter substrate-binding protein [Candidatus Limnocylindrales bacterium]